MPETASDNAGQAVLMAIKAVRALQLRHEYSPVGPFLTISAGVTTAVPADNDDWPSLLKLADDALNEAKREGRDRVSKRAN